MTYLIEFNRFIFENKSDDLLVIVEDCLLEFCDKYDLDSYSDVGYMVNDSFLPKKMLPDVQKMAKEGNVEIKIENTIRVQLYSKNYRDESRHELPTLANKWDNNINTEFNSCIKRIIQFSDNILTPKYLPEIKESFMGITFYLNFPDIA